MRRRRGRRLHVIVHRRPGRERCGERRGV